MSQTAHSPEFVEGAALRRLEIRGQLADEEFQRMQVVFAAHDGVDGTQEIHGWRQSDNALALVRLSSAAGCSPAILRTSLFDPQSEQSGPSYEARLAAMRVSFESFTEQWSPGLRQPVSAAVQAHIATAVNSVRIRAGLGGLPRGGLVPGVVHRQVCQDLMRMRGSLWDVEFGPAVLGAQYTGARELLAGLETAVGQEVFGTQSEYAVAISILALFSEGCQDGCLEALRLLCQAKTSDLAAKLLLRLPASDYARLDTCLLATCRNVPALNAHEWPLRAHPIDLLVTGFGRFGPVLLRHLPG